MVYCTVISLPFFAVLLLCLVLYPTIPYSREGKKKGVKRKVVGEFRKTRHPRNVKLDKVLEAYFSGAGNSRFSGAWNL
jgi:hypothetical protein